MKSLYHGSIAEGIVSLQPISALHGAPERKVVYLSGSRAYSLFYIWDGKHNKMDKKYVTCALKNGVVHYEEQFPGQLKAFYQGVSGWMYRMDMDDSFCPVENREDMWYSPRTAHVQEVEFISDVYEEIMACVQQGLVQVHAISEEKKKLLDEHIVEFLKEKQLHLQPECQEAQFYAHFFPSLWEQAQK